MNEIAKLLDAIELALEQEEGLTQKQTIVESIKLIKLLLMEQTEMIPNAIK